MSLPVECDARLASEVGPRAAALNLRGVAGSGGQADPFVLPFASLDLLLATGRVTASIFSPHRALFEASAQWAVYRWFWGLWWGSAETRLSSVSDYIRAHHRTAFSEAMGLGAALLVVEHIAGNAMPPGLWNGGGTILDVDTWKSSGNRPDFLVLYPGPGSAADTYVVEAKGNSRGRSQSIKQLETGVDQVLALSGTASRFVVGAALPGPAGALPVTAVNPGATVEVYAIEVPQASSGAEGGSEARNRPVVPGDREELVPAEAARLRNFAGIADASPLPPPEIHPIDLAGIEVVGRQLAVPGEGISAQLTVGVDRRVLTGLDEVGSLDELSEMRSAISADGHGRTPDQEPQESLLESGRAAKVARDGCAIAVTLR